MTLISDDIFYSDTGNPALLGGRSKLTGEYKFPFPLSSERENYERVPLKREGRLWTFTTQRFPPSRPYIRITDPEQFKPFALGYVELEGQVIVETLIEIDDFDDLKIGMPMTLIKVDYPRGDGSGHYGTYAFTPSEQEA